MKVLTLLLLVTAVKGQYDLNMAYGRSTMVHLFEWSWDDIANECENFLAPYDYGGVQVSPPSEHYWSWDNVWWDRYQPVSYKLDCKKGDEAAFRNMVTRCNNVGVRIYVDAVINHMAAGEFPATSSGGSSYDAGAYSFPAIPYSCWDFNVPNGYCPSLDGGVNDYGNANEVRNCNLNGLTDMSMGKSYVQDKIVEYLNNMISMGVAGFRVDAVKHMWPDHLKSIYDRLDNLDSSIFGSGKRPFFVQEVIDMGYGEPITASEYTYIGRVTEFKYSDKIGTVANGYDQMKWLYNFGEPWGFMSRDYALVFVDNHDNQRNHGGGGNIVTHTSSKQYKIASTFMLGYDYGVTRVMSSFFFSNTNYGGPSNSPYFTSDGACDVNSGWVCEHRWREIRNMVGFRKTCEGQGVNNWWDNGNNMIAFSRGSKGFIAINHDSYQMTEWLQTGMPAGTYCDVISGDKRGNSCTGNTITVYSDGKAYFQISNSSDSPIIAIHANSKL